MKCKFNPTAELVSYAQAESQQNASAERNIDEQCAVRLRIG